MTENAGNNEQSGATSEHNSRVFGGGGRQMVDPPLRVYREGRTMGAHAGPPKSAKPVYILLTLATIVLGLVALGLNL